MRRRSIVNLIKIATLTVVLGISGTVYCKASVSGPLSAVQSANSTGSKEVAKSENGDKNNENTVSAKKIEDLKTELSNIKGRNDEMNDRVLKSNTQIIDTLKKIKSKKGISKKKLRIFDKNEEAIAGKLESLTKLIDGLRENADRISFSEKKLNELSKNEGSSKAADNKTNEAKGSENKISAESSDNSYNISVQLESLIWMHLDRNRLFLQIFDTLSEISALLP